jgi:hypothetical protein
MHFWDDFINGTNNTFVGSIEATVYMNALIMTERI